MENTSLEKKVLAWLFGIMTTIFFMWSFRFELPESITDEVSSNAAFFEGFRPLFYRLIIAASAAWWVRRVAETWWNSVKARYFLKWIFWAVTIHSFAATYVLYPSRLLESQDDGQFLDMVTETVWMRGLVSAIIGLIIYGWFWVWWKILTNAWESPENGAPEKVAQKATKWAEKSGIDDTAGIL